MSQKKKSGMSLITKREPQYGWMCRYWKHPYLTCCGAMIAHCLWQDSVGKVLDLDKKQLLLNSWYLDTTKCQTISPKTENGMGNKELYDKNRGNGQQSLK